MEEGQSEDEKGGDDDEIGKDKLIQVAKKKAKGTAQKKAKVK